MVESVTRVPSGVQGLDEMLGGGFPDESIVLVCGGSGAGKTVFSLQYAAAALYRGETCVYVNLEEPMHKKRGYARAFGWDLEEADKAGRLAVLDYKVVSRGGGAELVERESREFASTVEREIVEAVAKIKAKHVIIDPLTSILVHEANSVKKRNTVYRLFEAIRGLGCSALVTVEGLPRDDAFYSEYFLSDGVIIMQKDLLNFRAIKTMRVDKMRCINHDEQPRLYAFTRKGLQVSAKEPVLLGDPSQSGSITQ